ncbi:MAG: endonuclease/exonuclease/phosphatase family protein [Prochlorococcus sp.]
MSSSSRDSLLIWPSPEVVLRSGVETGLHGVLEGAELKTELQVRIRHQQSGRWWRADGNFGGASNHTGLVVDHSGHWRLMHTPMAPGDYELVVEASNPEGDRLTKISSFRVIGESLLNPWDYSIDAAENETITTASDTNDDQQQGSLDSNQGTAELQLDQATAVDGVQTEGEGEPLISTESHVANRIIGSDKRDLLRGSAGRDLIKAGKSNDQLFGNGGKDKLLGNQGRDELFGGSGNDVLVGGRGRDLLNGGAGNDTLIGGAGADVFRFSAGRDQIRDFKLSLGDRLDVHDHREAITIRQSGDDLLIKHQGYGVMTLRNVGRGEEIDTDQFLASALIAAEPVSEVTDHSAQTDTDTSAEPLEPEDPALSSVESEGNFSLLVDQATGLAWVQRNGEAAQLISRNDDYWQGNVPLERDGASLLAAAEDDQGRLQVLDRGFWGDFSWILDSEARFTDQQTPTQTSTTANEQLFQVDLNDDEVIGRVTPVESDDSVDSVDSAVEVSNSTTETGDDGVSLRLMSFNVYYASLGADWRIKGIAQTVADATPDIASLQEMWGEKDEILGEIEARTGIDYAFSEGSNTWDGDILYRADRWQLLEDGVINHDGSRGISHAVLRHIETGAELMAYGMHPLTGVSEEVHLRNMETVTQHMAASAYADQAPALLMGDMNATEWSESQRLLREGELQAFDRSWQAPLTFEDSFRLANGSDANGDTGFGNKIDYVYTETAESFGGSAWETNAAWIRRDASGGSDHFPVLAEVTLLDPMG